MSVANENLHDQAAHNSRLYRQLFCLLLLPVATGCGRGVQEYTLIDPIATNVREPEETPEVGQDSVERDGLGPLSDASTLAANRSASPAKREHRSEPSVSEDSDSVEDHTPKNGSRFLIEPQRPGEDWPTFLGPTADGRSTEVQLIQQWPSQGPPMVWQFDAGNGFAACSVRGGLLYFLDQVNHYNRLACMDQATGEIQGEFTYPAPTVSPGGYQGPRCSPVVDEDRVYVLDEAGLLHCLRTGSNDVIWKTDTAQDFDVMPNRFGVAATPMVVGDLLVAIVGGGGFDSSSSPSSTPAPKPNGSALVAFDKLTGKVAYASGNFLADYASPVTADIQGVQWGFALLREGLVGFAPATGQIASNYPWRAEDLSSANCTSPVVVADEVFVSNAFGHGSALLKVEPSRFTPVWADDPGSSEKKFEAYFSTPVYHDGYLYGCSGKDSPYCELRCINWRTGEVMWSEPGLNRVSLILANGQLICLSEYGVLYLVEATPDEYRLVSKVTLKKSTPDRLPPDFAVPNLLEYPCWTAPVLSRGYLYLRSPNKLVCLDLSLPDAIDQQQPTSSKARAAETAAEDDTSRSPTRPPATSASPDRPDDHANPSSSRGERLIDSRTWTSSDGSRFDAAVIMIKGEKVTFLWSDGRQGGYSTANLSDADQELIKIVRRIVDK